MQAIQKILVAIDFSDYSRPTLDFAVRLAQDLGASLILANIINERDMKNIHTALASYDVDLFQRIMDGRVKERKTGLSEMIKAAGASEQVIKEIVNIDVPYRGLLRIIEEEKPDLLVIGTKGRGALADTIVGSCAQKMYRRCPIPLLSMRL
ncbi:MAG: universal stress protein [Desulfosarcinaceae bacterium]|jgi:nucleotide-binding universal stress UspA family protein